MLYGGENEIGENEIYEKILKYIKIYERKKEDTLGQITQKNCMELSMTAVLDKT
jgi:hypothetical protein